MIIYRKKFVINLSPYYRPILILFHTNVKYDNIVDRFELERSRAKVKVTVASFRKALSSI